MGCSPPAAAFFLPVLHTLRMRCVDTARFPEFSLRLSGSFVATHCLPAAGTRFLDDPAPSRACQRQATSEAVHRRVSRGPKGLAGGGGVTSQQRLLLALSLTLAILLAWSALFPPPLPEPPAQPVSQQKALSQAIERSAAFLPRGELERLSLGSFGLAIERKGGGIQELRIGSVPLLAESKPGLLHLEQPPGEPIDLSSSRENAEIRSHGSLKNGLSVERVIRQDGSHNYLLKIELHISNGTSAQQKAALQMAAYLPLYAKNKNGPEGQFQEGFAFVQGKKHSLRIRKGSRRDLSGAPSWVAAQGKSLTLILKPGSPAGMFHVEHSEAGSPTGWLVLPEVSLEPGEKSGWEFLLYAGPMRLSDLRQAGLEEAFTLGFFSGIAKLLLDLLNWSQGWLRSYGLAILFLSFVIWAIFFPMTWSGIRMMRAMGQLQPHVERLRKEHAKNPKRMNQELMELYKKHRVNPLSGCLPLIFQMPIFIALYQVLTRSAELNGARFLWIQDLSAPDAALRFPSEIPLLGSSLNILPILMAAAMFLQQRMTKSSQVAVTEEQQVQQKIFQFFPIFFGFLFYGLPSGLVLYWLTNTCLSIAQQLLLVRVHSSKG